VRPPGRYVELALEGRSTEAGGELLEDEARRLERLLLGMRRVTGVTAGWVDRAAAEGFVRRGLARWEGSRFALTEPGMFLANEVVLALAG
jgi:coproporphyrinogen III oxidase-like Fe-S oxidoreductase